MPIALDRRCRPASSPCSRTRAGFLVTTIAARQDEAGDRRLGASGRPRESPPDASSAPICESRARKVRPLNRLRTPARAARAEKPGGRLWSPSGRESHGRRLRTSLPRLIGPLHGLLLRSLAAWAIEATAAPAILGARRKSSRRCSDFAAVSGSGGLYGRVKARVNASASRRKITAGMGLYAVFPTLKSR